jgi:hypothetical protein
MSRLMNVEKAGYFPLPLPIADLILTYIAAPHGGRLLDPCAGEGAALVRLAAPLNLDPFGVELNGQRAELARQAVNRLLDDRPAAANGQTRILHDSYLSLKTPRDAYNCLYVNPPYDHDKEDGRLEYQWLWRTRPYLQPGGLLVWVVPQRLLGHRKAAAYLLAHYDQTSIFRFPDPYYEQFKQMVFFGLRRQRSLTPAAADIDRLWSLRYGPDKLPILTAAPEPVYSLPPLALSGNHFHFRSQFVDPADALQEADAVGATQSADWRRHLHPAAADVPLDPLMPLKIGHMNSVIAAGHLNNQLLTDPDNPEERLLIKGRSYKTVVASEFEEPRPGGGVKITSLETEVVVTDITTVDDAGEVTSYDGGRLEAFLTRWIRQLTQIVAQSYAPRYQFDLNGYGRLLDSLSRNRPIPGLNGQSGLLPAQKHAVAAVLTRLQTHPDALVIGEMGTGKTTIGAAIAAGRRAKRVVILCPPHLVDKWRRETEAVWPAAATMTLETPGDVDLFFAARRDNRPVVGVLKQTSARAASGWEHAYDYLGPAGHNHGGKGFHDVRRVWGTALGARELALLLGDGGKGDDDADADELAGRPSLRWPLSAKQLNGLRERGLRCPVCGGRQEQDQRPLAPAELKSARRFCDSIACGQPLFQFGRRRSPTRERGSFQRYAARERAIRAALAQNGAVPFAS